MFTAAKGRLAWSAVAVGAVVALAGCASGDPLDEGTSTGEEGAAAPLVVSSQAYYSNEIIAEIYSQALEEGGYEVDREFQIGQREVYLPELEAGNIDVFPEYIGSLLQALDSEAAGGTADEVYADLQEALPGGLTALEPADASDQNSWTVTREFADKYDLTDVASLANVTEPISVGGNSELATRPYGPEALEAQYGVPIAEVKSIEDSGGPLTVKALVDNDIQLANIYTADPNIKANDLVALDDPDGIFFPDNVVTIVSDKVDAGAQKILDEVNAALSADDLVSLNSESVNDQKSADVIAEAWLTENGLI
ncbi:MAG: ABC transporter substrate-binding protein [Microbacteriaceae bacterium]|nr:ABC transporter substrate-binding protein [Microbacteriaceae bacterium]